MNAVPAKLTREKFMKDFSISECSKLFSKVRKMEQIFETSTPSIASIKKSYDEDFIRLYITIWIINLNEFLNVRNKMNRVQTEETARLIVKEYYALTIADIHFIFENAKQGNYGKFYDRIDGTMILEWFKEHLNERLDSFERKLLQEDLRLKESRLNYNEINSCILKRVYHDK